jgi:two-component system nitrate/nitrite response regulator NarL
MQIYLMSHDPQLIKYWQSGLNGYLAQVSSTWNMPVSSLVLIDADSVDLAAWDDPIWSLRNHQFSIILASSTPSDEQGYLALQAGVSGYCHAFAPQPLLLQIIDVVKSGEIWAGRGLVTRLVAAINRLPAQSNPLKGLSERETQVAKLTAKGLSNKEIARTLDITERTVKAHLTTIFEKLMVQDRVQLVLRVNGLA